MLCTGIMDGLLIYLVTCLCNPAFLEPVYCSLFMSEQRMQSSAYRRCSAGSTHMICMRRYGQSKYFSDPSGATQALHEYLQVSIAHELVQQLTPDVNLRAEYCPYCESRHRCECTTLLRWHWR